MLPYIFQYTEKNGISADVIKIMMRCIGRFEVWRIRLNEKPITSTIQQMNNVMLINGRIKIMAIAIDMSTTIA